MTEIRFLPPAQRFIKKLRNQALKRLFQQAIDEIAENPEAGGEKTGDLRGVRCYDIYYDRINYEIAYTIIHEADKTVIVIMAGTRENFYNQLKQYWKQL